MTKQELKKILKDHIDWLNNNGGSRADLSGANLSRADLSGANLSRANLLDANLSRANLSGAYLSGANLSRADLLDANLSGANLSRANLSRANLLDANLSGAYLSRADLSGANLSRADLSGANLSGANLLDANLSRANLSGAYLSGAKLSRADLLDANLSGANLSRAKCDYKFKKKLVSNKLLMDLMFKHTKKYWIVYKTFGQNYESPKKWQIKEGKKIKEHLNTNRWLECSFGINVATLEWCKNNCNKQIYELHVPKTAEVCVPIWTDGKVRVDEAIIIKQI